MVCEPLYRELSWARRWFMIVISELCLVMCRLHGTLVHWNRTFFLRCWISSTCVFGFPPGEVLPPGTITSQ